MEPLSCWLSKFVVQGKEGSSCGIHMVYRYINLGTAVKVSGMALLRLCWSIFLNLYGLDVQIHASINSLRSFFDLLIVSALNLLAP